MKSKYNETHQVLVTVADELHQWCLRTVAHALHLRIMCASTLSHAHAHTHTQRQSVWGKERIDRSQE